MKIIFFLLAGLFAFLFLIFVYYLYNEKLVDNQYEGEPNNSQYNLDRLAPELSSKNASDKVPADNIDKTPKQTVAPSKQVFNISENKYTYNEAQALCKVFDSELATLDQLIEAYKKGADWCNYGWVKGQMAFFPTQKATWDKLQENSTPEKRNACGKSAGINGGYFNNPDLRFGVTCYGIKNKPRGNENIKQPLISDADAELQAMVNKFRKEIDNISILPFNRDKWGAC